LAIFAETEFTDQYGNKNTSTGAKIVITRDIADKIDWKGLAERHVTDPGNIYRIADNYSIHPGIRKNLKLNEVELR
jgi:hypothetical protein